MTGAVHPVAKIALECQALPVFEGPSASHALQPFFGVWITTRSRVLETQGSHSDMVQPFATASPSPILLCVLVLFSSLWFVWVHLRLSTITGFAALAPLWPSSSGHKASRFDVCLLFELLATFSGICHASQRQSWHSQSGAKQGSTLSKHTNMSNEGAKQIVSWCASSKQRTGFSGNGTMARSKSHPWPPSHGFCLKSRALPLTWNESPQWRYANEPKDKNGIKRMHSAKRDQSQWDLEISAPVADAASGTSEWKLVTSQFGRRVDCHRLQFHLPWTLRCQLHPLHAAHSVTFDSE